MSITRLDAAARLVLRDRELARDAVQEAFVRAWRDLPGLRDPDRFDAWLRRLVVNACIDLLRRRRSRPMEVEIDDLHPATADEIASFADRDALDRALASLSPDHRTVVVLHYYLGVPMPEAAISMGVPVGTAKSRLNRAIAHLRTLLEQGAEPDPAEALELAGGRSA
jgi:RNA polymerase sigma-70 factor (ECF subfamily)